ncbi:hypothetical protein [Kistimonas scapharcae]|uniref:hypothetical protein n=1 Tax=Kistimonas scapharcae TaxID=1036133 RepID=UPI0031EF368A
MESSIDKQQYIVPPPQGGYTGPSAPIMDDDNSSATAYGHDVTLPPYPGGGAYQEQGLPPAAVMHQGYPHDHPIDQGPPPPYPYDELPQNNQGQPAQETGCSIFRRGIKIAGGVALMAVTGLSGFVLTIALSPLFGLYIVGGVVCQGGCFILALDDDSAKVLAILFLGAVAIASLPVVFVSPIFGAAAAYRSGKWYFDGDEQLPSFLKDANHLSNYILSSDILRSLFGREVRYYQCSPSTEVHIHHHHTYRCW